MVGPADPDTGTNDGDRTDQAGCQDVKKGNTRPPDLPVNGINAASDPTTDVQETGDRQKGQGEIRTVGKQPARYLERGAARGGAATVYPSSVVFHGPELC